MLLKHKQPCALQIPGLQHPGRFSAGFTIIELIIALAMIGVITAVASINQSDFGNRINFSNEVYDLALRIRTAQISGTSVQQFQPNAFEQGYGVFMDTNFNGYIFYADTSGDKTYTGTGSGACSALPECIQKTEFSDTVVLDEVCLYSGGTPLCFSGDISDMNITYIRPDPVAYISENNRGMGINFFDRAVITLRNTESNETRSVTVSSSGYVSVE